MCKKILAVIYITIFSLGLLSTANAALLSRLGGLAVYDTDLNITWLSDANAGAGSSFDDGSNTTDGRMTWDNANAWAASLNIGDVTGWRLPTSLNQDGSEPCNGINCTGSEMGHLYYDELGGVANSFGYIPTKVPKVPQEYSYFTHLTCKKSCKTDPLMWVNFK